MTDEDAGRPPPIPPAARPIVVGYTGRADSQRALAWATAEAARRNLELCVLYAANYPGMVIDPAPEIFHHEPGAIDAAEEVTLRGVNEALAMEPTLRISGLTEVASPTRALIEAGDDAEMVVIGTRGFGPVAGAFLGSVAFAVAARAPCPVIIAKTHPRERPLGPDFPVVVGSDGSSQAAAAVQFAADRAADASAELEIVTCTGDVESPDLAPHEFAAAAERVAQVAAETVQQTRPGLVVRTRVAESPPERMLVDSSAHAGLLVVGTRGRGAFRGLFLGSVSHAVIYGAHCQVAVITDVER
jgi:nucleotide-binding universal stress UspA family protein